MRGIFKSYIFCPHVMDIRRLGARNLQVGAVSRAWGQGPLSPEAGSLGAKLPTAGCTGVWSAEPQSLKVLYFFAKITSF